MWKDEEDLEGQAGDSKPIVQYGWGWELGDEAREVSQRKEDFLSLDNSEFYPMGNGKSLINLSKNLKWLYLHFKIIPDYSEENTLDGMMVSFTGITAYLPTNP